MIQYEFDDIVLRRARYLGRGMWLDSIRCKECHEKFDSLINAEAHIFQKHGRKPKKREPYKPKERTGGLF